MDTKVGCFNSFEKSFESSRNKEKNIPCSVETFDELVITYHTRGSSPIIDSLLVLLDCFRKQQRENHPFPRTDNCERSPRQTAPPGFITSSTIGRLTIYDNHLFQSHETE